MCKDLQATISMPVHLFFRNWALSYKYAKRKSFCCKSYQKYFFVIFIASIKTSFYSYPPSNFIPHFPQSQIFLAFQKRNLSVFEKRTSSAGFQNDFIIR
jgi:hypothetical protein